MGVFEKILALLEEGLFENDVVNFNPGSTTHSIAMKSTDVRDLVSPVIACFAI